MLQLLAENLVRISIANIVIDVLSEVPLQAGQALKLAVSQSEGGIRLAVVGQGAGAATDSVTLAPGARADAAANPQLNIAPAKNTLTPLEKVAVSVASQTAASKQDGLAPLFANLEAVAGAKALPPNLQAAVTQLLAQRTSLDPHLTGEAVKNAFQKSGLFLEASLASGPAAPAGGAPDLKAALIVLRQTLLSSLGATAAAATDSAAVPLATSTPAPVPTPAPSSSSSSSSSSSLAPGSDGHEVLLPQARLAVSGDSPGLSGGSRVATGAALNLLLEGVQEIGNPAAPRAALQPLPNDDVSFHTNTPPPPFRGAQPAAQPIALPSLPPDAPLATAAHQLLADTDAAIARQTLLQVASLPDRVDNAAARIDPAAPRWNFEIPFVTPQGTAMAQFEIARDGGNEVEAAKRVWRARFSLDVEPAGPVHALVSLTGDTTSVRMWAERPATAAQLRAGAAQLSQALARPSCNRAIS